MLQCANTNKAKTVASIKTFYKQHSRVKLGTIESTSCQQATRAMLLADDDVET